MSPPRANSASAQSDPPRETTGGPRSRLRWLIPKTLGTRLALTYSGLALLIMAILGGSLIGTIREFYEGRLHVELLEETIVAGEFLAPLIEEGAAPEELNEATKRLADALEVRVTLIGRDGMVQAESHRDPETMENHADRPEVQRALLTGTGSSVRASETINAPFFYVARSIANGEAVVRIGMPLSVIDGLVQQIQRQVLFAAITAGVLMTGAGLFVARRISAALEEMQRQASAVAAGDLDTLVEPAPTQELGDLGRAFNAMTVTLRGTLEELSRVRTRLEATLADLSDGVVIIDEHGHVVLANGAALEMLGASGNVLGMPFVEVARDHELVDLVARAGTTADPLAEQIIQHSRSGKTLQAAARRLATHDERIGVIVLRDITELRRLEGVRRDFVANVSHELRTPLTSIRALVETLEAGAIHDPEVSSDFLGRIVSEVERLTLMVDELLDLARLESGRVTLHVARVEPASLIEHVVQRLAPHTERAGLTVRMDVDAGTPMVLCDRERIDQVLLNLVHNAVKFTPSGGTIDIRARRRGESVEFQVRDTGIGVMPDEMPRLFERFYKTDRARRSVGTGLGLAIAKHIVKAHGGSIWAEPNVPAGTTLIFRLPIDGPQETGTVEIEPYSLTTSR